MRIVFFGTPKFAANILDYLLKNKVNIIACVTKPDKKRGRSQKISPSPVKALAESHNLPVYQPLKARDPEFIKILKSLNPTLFVIAAYSEIFNEELLKLPPLECINVHASLLPKFRGAAPIERSIMAGEKETGVTIMKMAKELDAGDMLGVAKTPITETTTSGELYETLSHIGAEALLTVLQNIDTIKPIPQDHTKATYAPKVTSEEGKIDWSKPAATLHNHVRGLTPKPGAWILINIQNNTKRLIIKKTTIEKDLKGDPGEILPVEGLVVACGVGALRLLEVQLEGKNPLSAEAFLRGISKDKIQTLK